MYSQNNEDSVIKSYFGGFKGHLLSLGENDGITLSNSRQLILDGWSADLVEPALKPFRKLSALYPIRESEGHIKLHNIAIGTHIGKAKFFSSGTLLNANDTDLVSTIVPEETNRWNGTVDFAEEEVDVIPFEELLHQTLKNKFDFISIDCEGLDLAIFQQINLTVVGCHCVCVEFNGKNEHMFNIHARHHGMRLIHKNMENLIYVK